MEILMTFVGGLGFFLYGMKMMSEGLQKAAGPKMRSILEMFTRNRVVGVLVGTFFTALIQSSNAATVMIVSFVNSGLMRLGQTAGILMGANIGGTVTGQLIAFDLASIAPLFVMAGVLMTVFSGKRPAIGRLGEVILGFGILFVGISWISQGLIQIHKMPGAEWIFRIPANPLLAFLTGWIVTGVLQSGSATAGIVVLLAREGVLELPICLFLMLGCNMGCTMSAVLASIGGKTDARRTALVNLLFVGAGSLLWAAVFLTAGGPLVELLMKISGNEAGRMMANANTMIMAGQTIVLLPLSGWLVKASRRLIPGEDGEGGDFELEYIGSRAVFSPTTAVLQAVRELERMGEMVFANLTRAMNTLVTRDRKELEAVGRAEEQIDFLNQSITHYLVNLNQSTLPIDDAKSIGGLFHVANDFERIGDYAVTVAEVSGILLDRDLSFGKEAERDLSHMMDMVSRILTCSIQMFSQNDRQHLEEIQALAKAIEQEEKIVQQRHVERLTQNVCSPEAGMLFSDVVSVLERTADHAANIAFSISDDEQLL
ncbi:MAG TPA: Na/Pi cotransporter family protein [Candidatus Pullilachnospira intestinigallinarum]|nr:Na/Pi cotransporter family protein [Candidatus Pullilachnospira intestinigallinarum]